MGQGFNLKKLFFLLLLLGVLFSDAQLSVSLGGHDIWQDDFDYLGNNYEISYTKMPYSRLQLGLKYDNTQAILDKKTKYNCQGLMVTTKLLLNPFAKKSLFVGYNFGWLNSSLANKTILYNARGSFASESVIGYSFKIDNSSKWNLFYRERSLELRLPFAEVQKSKIMAIGYVRLLVKQKKSKRDKSPKKSMTQKEGQITKKQHLEKRLLQNQNKMERNKKLLQKYQQRIIDGAASKKDLAEKEFLLSEQERLQKENQEIKELIEL